MDDNVVKFTGQTTVDIDPDDVLEGAKGETDMVVICGWDKEGGIYFASSTSSGGEMLWVLEKVKRELLQFNEADM